jgi:hypothetical protein
VEVRWQVDPDALRLLDTERLGPFATRTYLDALANAGLGWRGASFGAALADGTRAATAYLTTPGEADSVPYGYAGIMATRVLSAAEMQAFLLAARRSAGVARISVRAIPELGAAAHEGGTELTSTHVVFFERDQAAGLRFAPKAAQSIRRAERSGCIVAPTSDADIALALYAEAASGRQVRYPDLVLRNLAAAGSARFYNVWIGDEAVATLVALVHPHHWMYWIAAQNEQGRKAEAGYLALSAMIRDAEADGAVAVNLGASTGLPGVAKFKRRFGAVEVPILEYRDVSPSARVHAFRERWNRRARATARRAIGLLGDRGTILLR